jgi:hypothetical protein
MRKGETEIGDLGTKKVATDVDAANLNTLEAWKEGTEASIAELRSIKVATDVYATDKIKFDDRIKDVKKDLQDFTSVIVPRLNDKRTLENTGKQDRWPGGKSFWTRTRNSRVTMRNCLTSGKMSKLVTRKLTDWESKSMTYARR